VRLTGAGVDVLDLARDTAARLSLTWRPPWHTDRAPVTLVADALVRTTDACGRIAADVLVLSRPEIAEIREPSAAGRGGSSTMPQKVNPVLSVMIRRAALSTPGLAAQLHLCAALSVDERADGAWHAEWEPLGRLGRHALTAADQTAELVHGLQVDAERMTSRADDHADTLLAEQRSLAGAIGRERGPDLAPHQYLGATDAIIDAILQRLQAEAP
jgi:3-carboxy-cis,cis-muconate cycloisomerase